MKLDTKILALALISGLLILLGGCASTNGMVSDSHKPGMTKILYEIDIDVSKTDAWKLLSNFGDLDWASSVTDVHYLNNTRQGIGMARHCDLKNDGYVVERIISWTEGSEFSYIMVDASDPITSESYVIWRINGDAEKSKVAFEVHYELKYGFIGDIMNSMMAKKKFSDQIVEFMGELKTHLEAQT